MKRKVYVQSAGVSRDFNWKCPLPESGYAEGAPSPYACQACNMLLRSRSKEQVGRMKCADGSYCAVARCLYIAGAEDLVGRAVYLNICVEGITAQEALAFETAYRNDVPVERVHYWPEITKHYIAGEDFDMHWQALVQSVELILQTELNADAEPGPELMYEEVRENSLPRKRHHKVEKIALYSVASLLSFAVGRCLSPVWHKVKKRIWK